MVSWTKPFETVFYHKAGVQPRKPIRNFVLYGTTPSHEKKNCIYFIPHLCTVLYGLEALTLTTPHMNRINAYYIRFLRRIIRASYYSHIPNSRVYEVANSPRLPSEILNQQQHKVLKEVSLALRSEICHSVVFCSAFKDRILAQGRRRGMQFPYWLEVVSKQYYPAEFNQPNHTALGKLRDPNGKTPKRVDSRAWL